MPESILDELGDAMLRLESLTRDCYEIARDYWDKQDKCDEDFKKMEHLISDRIAERLSAVLQEIDPEKQGRVFVAPRYRGVGTLKALPDDPDSFLQSPRYKDFTGRFGSLAENGVRCDTKKNEKYFYFMPVAYWNYYIYERALEFQEAISTPNKQVQLSGFSGWTAEHGFLTNVDKKENISSPIHGFHFAFDPDQSMEITPAAFSHGILEINFPAHTNCFEVTSEFMKALDTGKVFFSPAKEHKSLVEISKQPFPVIKPDVTDEERAILKAIFSTFFYSNFRELPYKKEEEVEWQLILKSISTESPPPHYRSLAIVALDLFKGYRSFALEAGKILKFSHYYAFLLNPSLDFRNKGSNDASHDAIGTVNFYANFKVPPILLGLIRKHLESIYHFLRELEDWEEATAEGKKTGAETAFKRMENVMGHELGRIYTGALNSTKNIDRIRSNAKIVLALNVMDSALTYGLLWAKSSDTRSLPAATGTQVFAHNLLQEAWHIFLGSYVVNIASDILSEEQIDELNKIWSSPGVFDLVTLTIDGTVDSLLRIEHLYRSLYRWQLIGLVNTMKHTVLPTDLMDVSDRLAALTKIIEGRRPIFKYCVFAETGAFKFSITNHYSGNLKPERSGRTGLALELAKEEIEAHLASREIETRLGKMRAEITFEGHNPIWTTALLLQSTRAT